MAMDDPLYNGQSNAGAFKLIGAMQPLKNSEQFVGVLHVKSGPVIADEINIFAVVGLTSGFDDRHCALARILERVRKQVCPDLL